MTKIEIFYLQIFADAFSRFVDFLHFVRFASKSDQKHFMCIHSVHFWKFQTGYYFLKM